jgi:hypothetical protein
MARQLIAYCGINCAKCPAYRLPRLGEKLHMKGVFQSMLEQGIKRAKRSQKLEARFQNAEVREAKSQAPEDKTQPEYIICDGCTMIDARCLKPCLECAVRCCAMETGVENCAHCSKFPCERLQGVWKVTVFKDAQPRLEKLHAGLATPRT